MEDQNTTTAEDEANITIEITNGLENVSLQVNGNSIDFKSYASFSVPRRTAITIQRIGEKVSVTIPNATDATKTPAEGVCMCISSSIAFDITPTSSINLTLQAGYLPGDERAVRCGEGF